MIYSRENGNQDVKTPMLRVTRGRGRLQRRQGDRVTRWGVVTGHAPTAKLGDTQTVGSRNTGIVRESERRWIMARTFRWMQTLVHWSQLDRKERGHTENNEETR